MDVFNRRLHPLRDTPQLRVYWEGFIRLSILAEETRITPKLAQRLPGNEGPKILDRLADEALLLRTGAEGSTY